MKESRVIKVVVFNDLIFSLYEECSCSTKTTGRPNTELFTAFIM